MLEYSFIADYLEYVLLAPLTFALLKIFDQNSKINVQQTLINTHTTQINSLIQMQSTLIQTVNENTKEIATLNGYLSAKGANL